jgi:hypothetical protein
MKKTIAVVVAVVISGALMIGFFVGRSTAAGGIKSYFAVLNTGQQGGPESNVGDGLGVAQFSFDPGSRQICTNMTVTGLDGGTIDQAHIHGPARAGTNAIILVTLNHPDSGVWQNDCGDRSLTKTEVEHLNQGRLYVNVHTSTFTGGEVRGQIFK